MKPFVGGQVLDVWRMARNTTGGGSQGIKMRVDSAGARIDVL